MTNTRNRISISSLSGYFRQKRYLELAVITFGFVILPFLQGILLSGNPIPPDPATTNAASLPGFLTAVWELGLFLFLIFASFPKLLHHKGYWIFNLPAIVRGLGLATSLLLISTLWSFILPEISPNSLPIQAPNEFPDYLLILLTLAASVSLEELLFRVYYLERLQALGIGRLAAVVVAVLLFAVGHWYQGFQGLIVSATLGLVLCLAWLRWQNFWLCALAHLLYNLTALYLAFFKTA